jgi:hypothetical protein
MKGDITSPQRGAHTMDAGHMGPVTGCYGTCLEILTASHDILSANVRR